MFIKKFGLPLRINGLSNMIQKTTLPDSVIAQKSARERMALQLIILREKYKVNFQPGMPVEINISRDDLANICK